MGVFRFAFLQVNWKRSIVRLRRISSLPSTSSHPVIHITLWIGIAIIVPSLPIAIGIAVAVLQGSEVVATRLLDGIELFLISLTLVAATYVELSRAELNWSSHLLFNFFVKVTLLALGVLSLIFLTLIYINNRVSSLDFDTDLNIALAVGCFLLIGLITTPLQFYIGYTRSKKLPEEMSP